MASQVVCMNCGVALYQWGGLKNGRWYWKHATGRHSKGKACNNASPVARAKLEQLVGR